MPDKYQEEIEEILRKVGEVTPAEPAKQLEKAPEDRPRRSRSREGSPATGARTRRRISVTPGKVMLAGLIVFLLGIKFSPLIWVGLGMLVLAYLLFFAGSRTIAYEKRWRGRSVEENYTTWERFKRWIKR